MSDCGFIRQVQDAVRFLLVEGIKFDLDPNLIRAMKDYVDSHWDVGSRARGLLFLLESLTVSLRYRELLREVRQGLADTQRLISQLLPFLEGIREKDPPQEVLRPVENLIALIDRLRLAEISTTWRPWAVFRTDRYLRVERRADFQRFFSLLSDLDALMAMASVTEELGFVLPELLDGPGVTLEGEGVFHPFLDSPVGNPFQVSPEGRVVFLTGPNMSGKTTYLKAVGVATYLAHLGMGVPASKFRFSPLQAIRSSLNPEESLREGLSYFMAEVRRVRDIAGELVGGKRCLVLFDEPFRGTNVKDAMDATRLVVLGLARCRTSGFVFSSHLVELVEDLRVDPAVRLLCFDGRIEDGQASYGFRIREGVSDQRFGLHLLEQEGVKKMLADIDTRSPT